VAMTDTDPKELPAPFSVRKFLREKEALVVHFSTPQRSNDNLRFPDDLIGAQALGHKGLSCSTIIASDWGPGEPGQNPGDANGAGCVGIVLDVRNEGSVCAVHPSDCATSQDSDGNLQYDGYDPTAEFCAQSLDRRQSNNEWVVKNFEVVGIFLFQPIVVQTRPPGSAERKIDLQAAIAPFPDHRIFSTENGHFVELDRDSGGWVPVDYASIIGTCD
jgi:hypothetical protein